MLKNLASLEVETSPLGRYSSQRQLRSGFEFSTSVEVRLGIFSPSVRPLVGPHFSRRTALRILAKLGMNVPYYKNKKVTRPFVRENSGSLIMRKNVFF